LHITLFKPGKMPVPPKLYGGGERAVYWLGKVLVEHGHQVTIIAHPQSCIPGAELRAISKNEPPTWQKLIPDSTDIVQFSGNFAPSTKKPFLIRVGGNGKPGERFHPNTVFVSQRHAALYGSRHFIFNGLDESEYSFSEKREDCAVFLAKARWPVKNFRCAVQMARHAA
jgi:hypothetical protein